MTAEGYWLGRPTQILRGEDSATLQVFDPTLEIWFTFGNADIEEDALAQGIPILRGPYTVDYTDIPADGDTKTLWTPQVGDVLLRLFTDIHSRVDWDTGFLVAGPGVDVAAGTNILASTAPSTAHTTLDSVWTAMQQAVEEAPGIFSLVDTAWVFASTAPLQVQFARIGGAGGPAPTAGHIELYALVARAVAP